MWHEYSKYDIILQKNVWILYTNPRSVFDLEISMYCITDKMVKMITTYKIVVSPIPTS